MPKNISDKDFAELISQSRSYRQVILAMGIPYAGNSYTVLKKRISRQELNIEHFSGQAHLRVSGADCRSPASRSIEEYLVENGPFINTHHLKQRLIAAKIKKHQCEICNGTTWLGKAIPIALDHENGNNRDNRLSNLRILCANCHAQTPTFAGNKLRKPRDPCPICFFPKKKNNRKTCGDRLCIEKFVTKK